MNEDDLPVVSVVVLVESEGSRPAMVRWAPASAPMIGSTPTFEWTKLWMRA
jgi:hypothetical protein